MQEVRRTRGNMESIESELGESDTSEESQQAYTVDDMLIVDSSWSTSQALALLPSMQQTHKPTIQKPPAEEKQDTSSLILNLLRQCIYHSAVEFGGVMS